MAKPSICLPTCAFLRVSIRPSVRPILVQFDRSAAASRTDESRLRDEKSKVLISESPAIAVVVIAHHGVALRRLRVVVVRFLEEGERDMM